jgi:P4 family phage/plasmid primase-like protien
MKHFSSKAAALKNKNENQILCNENVFKYFLSSGYDEFADLIDANQRPQYYEYIQDNVPVHMFLDIEIYKDKNPTEYTNHVTIVDGIIKTITDKVVDRSLHKVQSIVLSAHSEVKKSYHIILRITDNASGKFICAPSVKAIKPFMTKHFGSLVKDKIIDTCVYRAGLFRTYLSSKGGENRPLVKDDLSDPFITIETFVCHTGEAPLTTSVVKSPKKRSSATKSNMSIDEMSQPTQKELTENDILIIKSFVKSQYKYRPDLIRDVILNSDLNCINVNLDDTFCWNINREHKSNHQYIVIDAVSSRQKCHDSECSDWKHNEITSENFPKEVNEIILKCLKMNKKEQELIERAIQECKEYINNNFDEEIGEIQFDRNEMVFRGNASNTNTLSLRGQCDSCQMEHFITTNGYCLKCSVCNTIYPKNQVIPVDERYKNLNKFWTHYSQLNNNGTINYYFNNNNYYNGEEEFLCDVQLDASIFKDKELTKVYNQILDGHKVVKISELMSKLETDFKYTNGDWFFFNGMIWKRDSESLEFRKRIIDLSSNFNKIQNFYESKNAGDHSYDNIIKNLKSLVNKLHKTGFEDEIIKGAKMYYYDESFVKNLNSKKHLVPFNNGVYDLLRNTFRATTKEDYINLTVAYDYHPEVHNPEVMNFLVSILPNKRVRDYVLKKMSECLNGDIPNTNFLMFIGDGANGKSQLLNLMKLASGELGEKVEVTLLTRKRNNANEANTEKIKLMNKRFAFLSEPEDGEKINISLLKELTGSEEIVARGLYQESVSFVMEAKLFLACNELPEIKGEDTALWRRIRVVDFPSRFVDDPKEEGEFRIDRTLPSRMREDITWRQTFINILLQYYNKNVPEPVEVKLKTNEYRQENNAFYSWMEENVKPKDNSILTLKAVCELYLRVQTVHSRVASKYKKEIEKYIKQKYPNAEWAYKDSCYQGERYKGWMGYTIDY